MIVKVQISNFTNRRRPQVLMYDKTQEYMYEGAATEDILSLFYGYKIPKTILAKKYFNARFDKATGKVELLNEVNNQTW